MRIENIIKNLEDKIKASEDRIDNHKRNLKNCKKEYKKPFAYEEEYKAKLVRQNELNQELDLGKDSEDGIEDSNDEEVEDDWDLEM